MGTCDHGIVSIQNAYNIVRVQLGRRPAVTHVLKTMIKIKSMNISATIVIVEPAC